MTPTVAVAWSRLSSSVTATAVLDQYVDRDSEAVTRPTAWSLGHPGAGDGTTGATPRCQAAPTYAWSRPGRQVTHALEETLMSTVLHLLLLSTLIMLIGVVTVGLTVRWAVRRARRALAARLRSALGGRRGSLSTTLVGSAAGPRAAAVGMRARAWLPGPTQQVALVRRDLLRDVSGTRRAVYLGQRAGRPVEGMASVLRRLAEPAHELDVDLGVIAGEPDPATRQELLAARAERLDLLHRACAQVRHGVLLAGSTNAAPLLRTLTDELTDEVIALDLRAQAYQELAGR